MSIVKVNTLNELKLLYDHSAMTWEGLAEESFGEVLEALSTDGIGYLVSGKVMNELCHLTGTNAYPEDLNIFSIPSFKGLAILVGARWMDDIIDNNARRENYHPMGGSHYEC